MCTVLNELVCVQCLWTVCTMYLPVLLVQFMYAVFCAQHSVYSFLCTVISIQCYVYSVLYAVFFVECSVYNVLCSVQCFVFSVLSEREREREREFILQSYSNTINNQCTAKIYWYRQTNKQLSMLELIFFLTGIVFCLQCSVWSVLYPE